MSKNARIDEEVRDKAGQWTKVIGTLRAVTGSRGVCNEVKKSIYDGAVISTQTRGSETWAVLDRRKLKVKSVETSCLRGVC